MIDVSRWLVEQGLGHHAQAFAENGIAGDVLRDLTDADLKESQGLPPQAGPPGVHPEGRR
jgi:hypothetical protein